MLPIIKATFKGGKNVDDVIAKGDNSGLEKDINKMNFYGDNRPAMTGSVNKIEDYIKNANYEGGAEYIYLWDEKSKKWMMVDIYDETGLIPAFESIKVNEEMSKSEIKKEVKRLKKDGYNASVWGNGILVSDIDAPNQYHGGTIDVIWDEDGISSDGEQYTGDDQSYDRFLDIIQYPEDYNGQWESKQFSEK